MVFRTRSVDRRPGAAATLTALLLLLGLLASFGTASASAAFTTRTVGGSFGADGTSASTVNIGGGFQLDFNQANDKLYALVKGASNSVNAQIYSFDAPAHSLSGGAFPLTVAAPGAEPDLAVDNTTGTTANNIYFASESTSQVYGFDAAGVALTSGFPIDPPTPRDICGVSVGPNGNIWVTNWSNGSSGINRGLHEYSPLGVFQRMVSTSAQGGACHATLDSNGDLYVAILNRATYRYTAADGYTTATEIDSEATRAVKVDRTTHRLYVLHAAGVNVYDATGTLLYRFGGTVVGANFQGLAIDEGADTAYVGDGTTGKVHVFGPAQTISDATATPDGATDVTDSSATLKAFVTDNSSFATTWKMQVSSTGTSWNTVASGTTVGGLTAAPITGAVQGLQPNTVYRYRIVTSKGPGAPDVSSAEVVFVTDAVVASIESVNADSVLEHSARLIAFITPHSSETRYRFEWGTEPGEYPNRVPSPDAVLGSDADTRFVAHDLRGLSAGVAYYYRVKATNSAGAVLSDEGSFTTRAGPLQARTPELVSPLDKAGLLGVISYGFGASQTTYQIAPNGDAVIYPLAYGGPDTAAGGDTVYLARRDDAGWASTELTPPLTTVPVNEQAYSGKYKAVTSDLSCAVLISNQPLAPGAPTVTTDNGGSNVFTRDKSGHFRLLSSLAPTNPDAAQSVQSARFGTPSSDCRSAVWETELRYPGLNNSGIYRSDDGVMSDVGVMPDGSAATNAALGTPGIGVMRFPDDAVTQNTDRVYFSATSNSGNDVGNRALYLRDGDTTVKVSDTEAGGSSPNRNANFQVAANDGSRVAFMDNYGLTPDSSSGPTATDCTAAKPQPCALYVYDVDTGALTDISATADPANTNGATVAGVLATSEDLTHIYFAAQGQLDGKGRTYSRNVADGTFNVYLSDNGAISYVAPVTTAEINLGQSTDGPANRAGLLMRGYSWRSRSTPDGSELLFSTTANVTGYDSGGATEAYLYSADSQSVTCVSCRIDDAPSVASFGSAPISSVGRYDRPPIVVTDDGSKVFFTKEDALTPDATEGLSNVYMWNEGSLQLLTTGGPNEREAYLTTSSRAVLVGASRDGDNVFIATTKSLDPADSDGVYDLYDFRIGGGFPELPAPPMPCDVLGDQCQGGSFDPVSTNTKTSLSSGSENASSGPRKSLSLRKPSASQRRKAARSGVISLRIRCNDAGRVSAVAKGRVGKRVRRVGGTSKRLSKPGIATVRIKLNRAAVKQLRRGRKLNLSIQVRFSDARPQSVKVALRRTGR